MQKEEQGIYFPSQTKEEKVFLLIRKHWFNYIPFAIFGTLMILPIIAYFVIINYFSISLDPFYNVLIIVLGSIYLLSILAVQLYGFVSYYLDVYIVTDRRIVDIDQNGFFKREISELHLHQVQDVSAKVEGIFGTLLHFGDVHIQTAGERENFIFNSIPHPYSIAKQIVNLHEIHIEKMAKGGKGKTNCDPEGDNDKAPIPNSDHQKEPSSENKKPVDSTQGYLDLAEIENQARNLLSKQKLSDRLKNPGIYVSEDAAAGKVGPIAEEADAKLQSGAKDASLEVTFDEPKLDNDPVSESPLSDTANKRDSSLNLEKRNFMGANQAGEMKEGREIDLD